jgi:hypothetical protein
MKQSPKPGDMNQRMYAVVQEAAGLTSARQKDPKAVERGRLGGQARAKALEPAKRVEIAKAARASRRPYWVSQETLEAPRPKARAATASRKRPKAAKKTLG